LGKQVIPLLPPIIYAEPQQKLIYLE